MNAIEVNAVNYEYGGFALKDINFQVPKGYVTGFIGSNGVGKTTMPQHVCALTYQTQRFLHYLAQLNPLSF